MLTASSPLPADESQSPGIAPSAGGMASSVAPYGLSATLPPADFQLSVAAGAPSGDRTISNRDVFRLSLTALGFLTKAPISSHLAAKHFVIRGGTNIGVGLGGPGGQFDSNYTIWGLVLATEYMVDRNAFGNWRFALHWRNQFVGQIWFFNGNRPSGIEADSTHDRDMSRRTEVIEAQIEVGIPGAFPDVDIMEIQGPVLTLNEVMMVVISGFSDIASHDRNERVLSNRFNTAFPPYGGKLTMSFPWPPLSGPAWFTYDFVRYMLQKLALYYLSQPNYRPIRILLVQPGGGQRIGLGLLTV
ncbi:MAG: hypothetical protein Q9216_001532 [Gyalolechia sp. 2 TL-2023]